MKYQATNNFAFHILSKKQLNFYHLHLSKTTAEEVLNNLSYGSDATFEPDGSMTVTISKDGFLQQTIAELKLFLHDIENNLIETPHAYYSLTKYDGEALKEWYQSILGSVALIVLHDHRMKKILNGKWEFIEMSKERLFVDPFTFVFTKHYVKILYPLNEQNYELRMNAEKIAAQAVSKICKRINESYPGCEGLAVTSYVEEQTGLTMQEIVSMIQKKLLCLE